MAMALSFAAVPLIARGVGPAGRGEVAAAVAAFAIAPVLLAAGMPLEMRRRSVGATPNQWVRAARDIAALSFFVAAGVASGVATLVFPASPDTVRWLVFAGITLAPTGVVWSVDIAVLVGAGRATHIAGEGGRGDEHIGDRQRVTAGYPTTNDVDVLRLGGCLPCDKQRQDTHQTTNDCGK